MTETERVAAQLVDVCHRLYQRGYVSATDGNVSARLTGGSILTTRTGVNKGDVTRADIVEVDMAGRVLAGTAAPSSELPMHLYIYRSRRDVAGVVHAHPVYATGFAAAHLPLDQFLLPEVILGLGVIPLARYATPSTDEVGRSLEPFVASSHAILLANHGVVTYGRDLTEAYFRMEKTEQAAQITFIARMLGGEKALEPSDVERLRALTTSPCGCQDPVPLPDVQGGTAGPPEGQHDEEELRALVRQMISSTRS